MKALKILTIATVLLAGCLAGSVSAQTNRPAPPVIIDKNKDNIPAELKQIKTLAKTFEAKRDAYLAGQKALLAQLKSATEDQRAAIREQLQDNRQTFLAELKEFRKQIGQEVADIKAEIHNQELGRLIDQGKLPVTGRGHKGQGN